MPEASSVRRNAPYDREPLLVRTSRIPTAAFVVGDADQPSAADNVIEMKGADTLLLLVSCDFSGGMTSFTVKVEFSWDQVTWYEEGAIEVGAIAAALVPVATGAARYTFGPDAGGGAYTRAVTLPMDALAVRVSVLAAAPAAGDLVEIKAVRSLRNGGVTS